MGVMDLFSFAKNMGRKLFSRDDEAADKIKEHIEEANPGVTGVDVSFDNGVVSISGDAATPDAMEKAVLMAGNVQGVEKVEVGGMNAPAQTANVEFYEIEKGDTLSGIAKQFYGNAMDYPKIFEANREVIKDPDLIFPGQKIRIPK